MLIRGSSVADAAIMRVASFLGRASTDSVAAFFDRNRRFGDSPRFRDLDRAEAYFRGTQHDQKTVNWDGQLYYDRDVRMPFVLSGGAVSTPLDLTPWYNRRPFVRSQLCHAIVERFTGLLFGETRTPAIRATDANGQGWLDACLKAMQWWRGWSSARDYGGSQGSVVPGVKLRKGRPLLDVLNAKWCTPQWTDGDPESEELDSLEVLYKRPFGRYEQQRDGPVWKEGLEWYRRIITRDEDVAMVAPVEQKGAAWTLLGEPVAHGLGFVPYVWVRNSVVLGDPLDGKPDCDQQWDNLDAIDALLSQAFRGTHYNADPTLVVKSKRPTATVRTGSSTAITLDPGDDASLLELAGSGGEAAAKRAIELRDAVLENTHCVLTIEPSGGRTATEVERLQSAMLDRADELRAQYGDAMERLAEMFIRLCRKVGFEALAGPMVGLTPPADDDVTVEWPPHVQMGPEQKQAVITMHGAAIAAGLESRETAIRQCATVLGIPDVDAEIAAIRQQAADEADRFAASAGLGTRAAPGYEGGEPQEPEAPRKRLLGEFGEVKVWLVDGEAVRNAEAQDAKIRFSQGGHDLVYPDMIPEGEVWIDDGQGEDTIPFTLVHELTERSLMAAGMEYQAAHALADAAEAKARENPAGVEDLLKTSGA